MNKWLQGLLGAVIGGVASSISMLALEPQTFNFGEGLASLGKLAFVSAITSAAFYLKQSPFPKKEEPPSKVDK